MAPSPMLAQWFAAKADHPDALLFFRMGDFYELFFDDAQAAAAALDIALTARGEHDGKPIAMCGVPAAAHESYLARLIRRGFRVAIVEQTEDPESHRRKGGKGPLPRAVVRLVTPGTVTEDSLLDATRSNWLVALAGHPRQGFGLAAVELTTGSVETESLDLAALPSALARRDPAELLLPDRLAADPTLKPLLAPFARSLAPLPEARFRAEAGSARIAAIWGVTDPTGFGSFTEAELGALGTVLDYAGAAGNGALPGLSAPRRLSTRAVLEIDPATRRNLDLATGPGGGRDGSLLDAVDRTVSPGGARLLASRLAGPLTDPDAIRSRQEEAAVLVAEPGFRSTLRQALREAPDLARALSRIGLARGTPRDLGSIRDALAAADRAATTLDKAPAPLPASFAEARTALRSAPDLAQRLGDALVERPPPVLDERPVLRTGCDAELDAARALRDDSRAVVAGLEARYRSAADASSLRIRHTSQLGYFAEVSEAQGLRLKDRPPDMLPGLAHRQTMAGRMRFTTAELTELDSRIDAAADAAASRERLLFTELCLAVRAASGALSDCAEALAILDVASASAELACRPGWILPQVDASTSFVVEAGRHPVVEPAVARSGGRFVPNDCDLSPGQRLWLVTGPNMAGKSTFLRQNALIAILAQAGLPVPAERARIGVVDRLFSRVGAADDLAAGRSTFMVEMVEAAAILNQAGPRSLVILDEIGRGTATWDGLAIAWAVVEALHDRNRSRALFATHFHELVSLTGRLPELSPRQLRVKEWRSEVVFLHEVAAGAADRSYGLHVARLAGIPAPVVARARTVLDALEKRALGLQPLAEEMPLFAAAALDPPPPDATLRSEPTALSTAERLLEAVVSADLDALSPRDAQALLWHLRELASGGNV